MKVKLFFASPAFPVAAERFSCVLSHKILLFPNYPEDGKPKEKEHLCPAPTGREENSFQAISIFKIGLVSRKSP